MNIKNQDKSNISSILELPPLFLASGSPRRRELLKSLGFSFEILVPNCKEQTGSSEEAVSIALTNALMKARAVVDEIPKNALAIAADTVVALEGALLDKPQNKEEAISHLQALSGRTHKVVTGLALISQKYGEWSIAETTHVTFKNLTSQWIERYTELKEPYDKAGAYAIQGLGAMMIEKISGSYTNVMGFPIEIFMMGLEKLSQRPIQDWFEPRILN